MWGMCILDNAGVGPNWFLSLLIKAPDPCLTQGAETWQRSGSIQFSTGCFSHHLFNYSDRPAARRGSPCRAKHMGDVGERPQIEQAWRHGFQSLAIQTQWCRQPCTFPACRHFSEEVCIKPCGIPPARVSWFALFQPAQFTQRTLHSEMGNTLHVIHASLFFTLHICFWWFTIPLLSSYTTPMPNVYSC